MYQNLIGRDFNSYGNLCDQNEMYDYEKIGARIFTLNTCIDSYKKIYPEPFNALRTLDQGGWTNTLSKYEKFATKLLGI